MNIHAKPKPERTRNRQPHPDCLRTQHGAHHNATAPMLRLMDAVHANRRGFVARLRTRFDELDGGEILVGWHLVDRGFFDKGHELHSLLDGDAPLPRQLVEVMLEFIGQPPERFWTA